jgi:hypothetical protein
VDAGCGRRWRVGGSDPGPRRDPRGRAPAAAAAQPVRDHHQVVVDLSTHTSFIPSFIAGSQTLFIGDGSVIAYVDFSGLKGSALQMNAARTAVTVHLPAAQLEPPILNVDQSYVFAEQQGLVNRVGSFFSGNPNSQQSVYIAADQKISSAAAHSGLVTDAEHNTTAMLTSMLTSLGFRHITVDFARS